MSYLDSCLDTAEANACCFTDSPLGLLLFIAAAETLVFQIGKIYWVFSKQGVQEMKT